MSKVTLFLKNWTEFCWAKLDIFIIHNRKSTFWNKNRKIPRHYFDSLLTQYILGVLQATVMKLYPLCISKNAMRVRTKLELLFTDNSLKQGNNCSKYVIKCAKHPDLAA